MKKVIVKESDLIELIKRVIVETSPDKTEPTPEEAKLYLGYLIKHKDGMRPYTDKQGFTKTEVKNDVVHDELKKYLISIRNKKSASPLSSGSTIMLNTIKKMSENVSDKNIYIDLGSTYNESVFSTTIGKMLSEQKTQRYMFFSNLEQMRRQCDLLLDLNHDEVESLLDDGHDWAQDHISEAKNNMDQVFDFIMNETKRYHTMSDEVVMEGRKKSGTKLCARGKSAAKSKFDVYPSAYANGYAVQVCKGKKPGLDGKKRCSPPYC
jgi:hypothetical protein